MRQPSLSAHPQAGPEIHEDDGVSHTAFVGGDQASVIETSIQNLW